MSLRSFLSQVTLVSLAYARLHGWIALPVSGERVLLALTYGFGLVGFGVRGLRYERGQSAIEGGLRLVATLKPIVRDHYKTLLLVVVLGKQEEKRNNVSSRLGHTSMTSSQPLSGNCCLPQLTSLYCFQVVLWC